MRRDWQFLIVLMTGWVLFVLMMVYFLR